MSVGLQIAGLKEFQRNLKKLGDELPKALRIAFNAAADLIVNTARPRVPRSSGRAAATIKARSTAAAVRVSGGGNKAPYYPWLDFGGRVGRNRSVRRAFLPEGRYIYAALDDKRGAFDELVQAAIVDAARSAGVEVDA